MTYYNPLFAYGLQRFVDDGVAAGLDGIIVPDLPPEEADELEAACRAAGLATIYLLAPTSTEERIKLVAQRASGFVYLVSVTGITGARAATCRPIWPILSGVCVATQPAAGRWLWHRHGGSGRGGGEAGGWGDCRLGVGQGCRQRRRCGGGAQAGCRTSGGRPC